MLWTRVSDQDFFATPRGKQYIEEKFVSITLADQSQWFNVVVLRTFVLAMQVTKRLGLPKELDGALLLLASDAGSFITGATLQSTNRNRTVPLPCTPT